MSEVPHTTTDFDELELYLQQAQKEIGQVFDDKSLTEHLPSDISQGHSETGNITTLSQNINLSQTENGHLKFIQTSQINQKDKNGLFLESLEHRTMDHDGSVDSSTLSQNESSNEEGLKCLSQQFCFGTSTSVSLQDNHSSVTNRWLNTVNSGTSSTPYSECNKSVSHGSLSDPENSGYVNEVDDLSYCSKADGSCRSLPHSNLSNSFSPHLYQGENKCSWGTCEGSLNEGCSGRAEINSNSRSDMEISAVECAVCQLHTDAPSYQETCVNENVECMSTTDKSPVIHTTDQSDDIDGFIAELTESIEELFLPDKGVLKNVEMNYSNQSIQLSNQSNQLSNDSNQLMSSKSSLDNGEIKSFENMKEDKGVSPINHGCVCGFSQKDNLNSIEQCTCRYEHLNFDKCNSLNVKSQPEVSDSQSIENTTGVMYRERGDEYVNEVILDRAISNDERGISMGENPPIKIELTDFHDTEDGVVETDLGYYWLTSTIEEKTVENAGTPTVSGNDGTVTLSENAGTVTISDINMEDKSVTQGNMDNSDLNCEEMSKENDKLYSSMKNSNIDQKAQSDEGRKSLSALNPLSEMMSLFDRKYLSLDRAVIGKKRISQDDFQLKSVSDDNLTVKPLRRKYSAPPSFCKVYKVISIDIPKMDKFVTQDKSNVKRRGSTTSSRSGSFKMGSHKSEGHKINKGEVDNAVVPQANTVQVENSGKVNSVESRGKNGEVKVGDKTGNYSYEDNFEKIMNSVETGNELQHKKLEPSTMFKDKTEGIPKGPILDPPVASNLDRDDSKTDLNMQPTMVWDPGVPMVPPRTYMNKLGHLDKRLQLPHAPPPPSPHTSEQLITNMLNNHVGDHDQAAPPLPERRRIPSNTGNGKKLDKKVDKNVSMRSDSEASRKQHDVKGVSKNNLKDKHTYHKKMVNRLSGSQSVINTLMDKRNTKDMLDVLESYKFVENFGGQSQENSAIEPIHYKHQFKSIATNTTDSLDRRKMKSSQKNVSASVTGGKKEESVYATVNRSNVAVNRKIDTVHKVSNTTTKGNNDTDKVNGINDTPNVVNVPTDTIDNSPMLNRITRKVSDKPQSYSEGMKNKFEHSPDFQVMVNSLSPVLLRRNNSSRSRKKSGSVETSPDTTPDVSPRVKSDKPNLDTLTVPKSQQESLFIDPEMARTWHGATSFNWSKHYGPQMKAMMKELDSLADGEHGSLSNGLDEEALNLEMGSKTLPSKSLLDEMHKKFCADQYHNIQESILAREMVLLRLKSQPTVKPKRSQSFNIRMGTRKSATSLHADASPLLHRIHKRVGIKTRPDFQYSPKPQRARETTPDSLKNIPVIKAPDSKREEAEIEAIEACRWLRETGFPQYAQLYEDGQFPVDIESVEKDHDFLDKEDIQSLFREAKWKAMKFAKIFKIIKGSGEVHSDNYILFDDFVTFVRSKDNQRPFNIKRSLSGFEFINNCSVVPVLSVLKYCFRHADTLKSCEYIAKVVEQELLNSETTQSSVTSTLDLYNLIAKTKFLNTEFFFENVFLDESCIETLIVDHKSLFSNSEWNKICWFENNFSKSVEYESFELEYEDIVALKLSKFQSILSFKECSEVWYQIARKQIKDKKKRIDAAGIYNNIEIVAAKRHLPVIIDGQLLVLFQKYCEEKVQHVISFDTVVSSKRNSIQAVVVTETENLGFHPKYLSQRAFYYVRKRHGLKIECISFFQSDNLKDFIDDDHYSRFSLRDELEVNGIPGALYTWTCDDVLDATEDISHDTTSDVCDCCFRNKDIQPLSAQKFNILTEWHLETPIETQILLEKFISRKSLRRTKNEDFNKHKLTRLYRVYDILLNVSNKHFIGIHQRASTDELLIEYKSVNSVFDVTASAGTTTSLNTAETSIRKHANVDLCYYNAYLKYHSLSYTNIHGQTCETANLRQSHLIVMLDNLVRLKYNADPNPGESRSKQLCTLPITLQGLPLDSEITNSWHADICDGTESCECKKPIEMTKDDVNTTLMKLDDHEKDVKRRFCQLMSWGYSQLWNNLTDDILVQITDDTDKAGVHMVADIQPNDSQSYSFEDNPDHKELDLELDLENILNSGTVDCDTDYQEEVEYEDLTDDDELICDLEKSLEHISLLDVDETVHSYAYIQTLLSSFGFNKFKVPPLLYRHPPPAIGKDDDLFKTKEILDDILQKMGYLADPKKCVNRILCGPDNKIGQNLLYLINTHKKYKTFLPEFPLLHLRKSLITILFSAYKDTGLVQILQFMRDDNQDEWKKLVSAHHIDTATRHVKRIALSLHLAFLVVFSKSLAAEEKECFLNDMESDNPSNIADSWSSRFEDFLNKGSRSNATFALHRDMMTHCDNVVAVSLAERLGGPDGYALLLAAVKGSIRFLFVNNATSYAPYCVKLLYHHYSAGHYHKCLKETLYTTPFKSSIRNFASDTKRELDHIEAMKGFRSGTSIPAVSCRMSLIDSLNEVRENKRQKTSDDNAVDDDSLGWDLTPVDKNHIFPTADLILRKGGLSTEQNGIPFNVYTKDAVCLPVSVLDQCSDGIAEYLMYRFLVKEGMYQLKEENIPLPGSIFGPSELITRAKRSKGITIKRIAKSKVEKVQSEREAKETVRQKNVARETKLIDCYSSENNACQALLKPDSSKPKVMKAVGMQRALRYLLTSCLERICASGENSNLENIINLNINKIPAEISMSMKICSVEFAGMKFKTGNVKTGKDYLKFVESTIGGFLQNASNIKKMIICEEKYSFTPDELKAATREQRRGKSATTTVDHLKTDFGIINDHLFNKEAVTKTDTGKRAISIFLAQNLQTLRINHGFDLIVDSQMYCTSCSCEEKCPCEKFCTPIQRSFHNDEQSYHPSKIQLLSNIKQKKGEAEMSVVDWLIEFQEHLQQGDSVVSIITSGDIDAVYIHMFTVSKVWKRNEDGTFKNTVYVILQKPRGKNDVYNITAMLQVFEEAYNDRMIGIKVSLGLCLGGNDFYPKCHQMSHETVLKLFIENSRYRQNLFIFADNVTLNTELFVQLYKTLFCPKKYQSHDLSYDQIRALTIGKVEDQKGLLSTTNPKKWLPPETAIHRLAELFQLQMQYIGTAGVHDAEMPNFLESTCLEKISSGEIEYNFGPDAQFASLQELPNVKVTPKRQNESTPQRGARRKRQLLTSTPKTGGNTQ